MTDEYLREAATTAAFASLAAAAEAAILAALTLYPEHSMDRIDHDAPVEGDTVLHIVGLADRLIAAVQCYRAIDVHREPHETLPF